MTPEEALKVVDDRARYSMADVAREALRVLADALREAQAQTVQMREDAARVCDAEAEAWQRSMEAAKALGQYAETVQRRLEGKAVRKVGDAIRALPAPGEVVAVSTFSPAPAVAPKPGWRNLADGTVASGPNMPSFVAPVAAPKPAAFDTEAALGDGE